MTFKLSDEMRTTVEYCSGDVPCVTVLNVQNRENWHHFVYSGAHIRHEHPQLSDILQIIHGLQGSDPKSLFDKVTHLIEGVTCCSTKIANQYDVRWTTTEREDMKVLVENELSLDGKILDVLNKIAAKCITAKHFQAASSPPSYEAVMTTPTDRSGGGSSST